MDTLPEPGAWLLFRLASHPVRNPVGDGVRGRQYIQVREVSVGEKRVVIRRAVYFPYGDNPPVVVTPEPFERMGYGLAHLEPVTDDEALRCTVAVVEDEDRLSR